MEDAAQIPTMTNLDFLTALSVEPTFVDAFCENVDVALRRAADVLAPIVEHLANRILKIAEALTVALQVRPIAIEDADSVLNKFGHAVFETDQSLLPWIEVMLSKGARFVGELEAAPKVEGHEDLLVELLSYHPLMARFVSYTLIRIGTQYTDERNDEQRAAILIGSLAGGAKFGSLRFSRQAMRLQAFMCEDFGNQIILTAIEETHVRIFLSDFKDLVELAIERNELAIRSLIVACKHLQKGLSSPRGRSRLHQNTIHAFFLRFLHTNGVRGVYTHDEVKKNGEFDRLTRATRLALKLPNFRPQAAAALLRSVEFRDRSYSEEIPGLPRRGRRARKI